MWLSISLAAAFVSLLAFLASCFAVVRSRGRLETRRGREVHADLVQREAERESRLAGGVTGTPRTWASGTGAEIGGEATISWDELVEAWRRGDRDVLRPWFLLAASVAAMIVCTSAALFLAGGVFRLVGVGFVLVGLRMAWVVRRSLVERLRKQRPGP